MSEYGVTLNCSYVQDKDGIVTIGAHYTNTDGQDIEVEKKANNLEDAVLDLYEDLITQMLTPPTEEESVDEEVDIDFVLAENQQLREEIAWLRERYLGAQQTITELNQDFDEVCEENEILLNELQHHDCKCKKKDKKEINWIDIFSAMGWVD